MITTHQIEEQFRQKIEAAGITAPAEIIPDGALHRFPSNGDRHDDAGWYALFCDGVPAGAFGCWRLGIKETWCSKSDRQLTEEERRQYRQRLDAIKEARDAAEHQRQSEGAQRAQQIWDAASAASPTHPYCQRKRVQAHGLRLYRGPLVIAGRTVDGALLCPLSDIAGQLWSLEFLLADGTKLFLPGGRKRGCFHQIGTAETVIALVEGYATGASVHESTALPVLVGFDAGNLLPVAKAWREHSPDCRMLVCGDHDANGTGQTAARDAAAAVEGVAVVPETAGDDWNDVLVREGPEAVGAALLPLLTDSSGPRDLGDEPSTSDPPMADWPELDPAALHGVAGELVDLLLPQTESDPVALLATILSEFGCCVGRAPHVVLDGSRHSLLFWPVIVGRSSKSRKGSSNRWVGGLFRQADPAWTRGECRGTLSSGEGLVQAVRDPAYKEERDRETGALERRCVDSGIEDKRLFLMQSEFGAVLRVMKREGNSLSGVLRDAWDGEDLCPMTKNNTIRATHPHITVVGHITMDELRRNLTDTEMSNGFGNRFVYLLVRRSKELPEASEPDPADLLSLGTALRAAIGHGRRIDRLVMSAAAREAWVAIYSDLSADRPGVVGSLLGRAEAQVQRLAALYCLLDQGRDIELPHLEAALALWSYAEASTSVLFGESTGDSDADTLLAALRQSKTLTDTDVSAVFGFNRSKARLDQVKDLLLRAGLVRCSLQKTHGRPVRVWTLQEAR
jgi:phage/plasmid primase-like uncharacterized protein